MIVSDVMTANPACCTPNTLLSDVARMMLENDCGEIPVIEDRDNPLLLGVITDRDIVVRAVAQGRGADTPVAEVMTNDVVSVRDDADLEECLAKMEEHQIRRVPVLDGAGRICGIVAQADIALNTGRLGTGEMVRDISRTSH